MASILRLSLAVGIAVSCTYGDESVLSNVKMVYSAYHSCETSLQPVFCLKMKALKMADRALQVKHINLLDGVSLVTHASAERSLNDVVAAEDSVLSSDPAQRQHQVDSLLWNRVARFLDTRSLQLTVPTALRQFAQQLGDEHDQQGRGKRKKLMPLLMLAAILKGGMLAMALKGLALLAGKALLVAKIALVLASLIALKKLFSGGGSGGEKTTYEIVKQPVISHTHDYGHHESAGSSYGGSAGYGRSLEDTALYPHVMAYRRSQPLS